MPLPAKKVCFGDNVFIVDENVYEPAEDSFLLAENLEVESGKNVVDMGTGCGILGVLAAKKARRIMAVDVNPYAIRCAKENAKLNNVLSKMAFVQGDLFAWLREKTQFDLIVFNAPYLPADEREPDSWSERAWTGGANGRQIIDRFISEASKHSKRSGHILLMQSTLADVDASMHRFAEYHMRTRVVEERALPFFETLVLIEARF